MSIATFLKSEAKNAWLTEGIFDLFVRKSVRYIDAIEYKCLDIASVSCMSKLRGKGMFWRLMGNIETEIAKNHLEITHIYIEAIVNRRLAASLLHNGYFIHEGANAVITPNMYYRIVRGGF